MATPLREQLLGRFAGLTNRFQVWYRLPFLLAMPTILGHRVNMREQNLSDTERDPSLLKPSTGGNGHDQRQADGSYTDLGCPWMGMAGARFGRNVPIGDTHGEQPPELYEPNPRQVSRDLLARRSFVPVPHLNVLVPAWLQFMVHDWLSHGGGDTTNPPHKLPLPPGDDWPGPDMTILRTLPDDRCCPADQGQPATYRNTETHWWDGSQIYGSDLARQRLVRTDPASGQLRPDGKIHLDAQGHLPVDATSDLAESRALRREWQLVGRAVGPAHAVCARAQCDRGPAARRLPHGRWRMAVPEGAAGERRPHCQDPHRRMDAGADELAGRAHGHARKLLGPARRALRPCLWPARRRGRSSPASRVQPPIITPPLTP